jgi:hypothetical protein
MKDQPSSRWKNPSIIEGPSWSTDEQFQMFRIFGSAKTRIHLEASDFMNFSSRTEQSETKQSEPNA